MSLRRRLHAFIYAGRGIIDLFRHTPNARIHLAAASVVIATAAYVEVSRAEWYWLIACIGAVLVAEAFNTAIEYLTDLVSPDYHPLAGKTKDVAAGAVLLAAITAAVIGAIILGPYLL